MLGRFIRCSALLGILVLAVLSWTPGQQMLRTRVLRGPEEHFLAHLLVAMIVAAAVRRPNLILWILLALVGYAGLLELGQYLVPGRSAAPGDFAASALGATLGVGCVWLSHIMSRRARRRAVKATTPLRHRGLDPCSRGSGHELARVRPRRLLG